MSKKTIARIRSRDLNNAGSGLDERSGDEWPEQLAVRIARCYYELGMTQQQIAEELGIGRARVIRLLAEARERGVVTISINSPLTENLDLAERLVNRFNLESAEVCLAQTHDELTLAQQLGAAAGDYIWRFIDDNMTISVGWGMTLKELVKQLDKRDTQNVSVVSLLGSLTRMSSVSRFEATTEFAEILGAECHYLTAPIVCDSKQTREHLVSQSMFEEVRHMGLSSDLAIVSIGGLDSATIRKVDMVSDADFISVRKKGAIGNFLGYYIDDRADIVAHPINERIIGISGEQFRNIPRRIMISGGLNKVTALNAVLEEGLLTDIVTDSKTAKALLNMQS
ncbi:MAG: sugar-binding transcriptional regulator [Granulosicoccus sp.]|nr:sugar-binding transcriptional regulator [Granulosicoccus sp.]